MLGFRSRQRVLVRPWRGAAFYQSARKAASSVPATVVPTSPATTNEPLEKKEPWHVFTPNRLAVVNTVGNLSALAAAASHDHMLVRLLAGMSSTMVMCFNLFMPKPLKTHQQTAAGWGFAFAMLHFTNLALLLRETSGVRLSEEENDIYEHGFQNSEITPRQFRKLLDAGATVQEFKPGQVLVEIGKPVDKVIYVSHGSCRAEFMEGVSVVEYHQDVFIGELQPKRWRAEYLGCGTSFKDVEADDEKERLEEEWLLDHAVQNSNTRRKVVKDLRQLLRAGLVEKLGSVTKLQAGAAWVSTVRAGDDGCKVLVWPLGTFTSTVAKDEKMCDAMEKLCTLGIASKISAGAKGKALDSYYDLLTLVVSDGKVDPQERHAMSRYRARHAIPDAEHARMLSKLGWSLEEYDVGVLHERYESDVKSFRRRWFS